MRIHIDGEPIISLTSWKARIDTVGLTIFSLIENCPGFHIVLCLSSDEFPQRMDEMPSDIRNLASNNIIEIIWVKKNYKAYKKFLFTMLKYPDVPVISADDDCLYTVNYAKRLLDEYRQSRKDVIRYTPRDGFMPQGPCTLYAPKTHIAEYILGSLTEPDIKKSQDDDTTCKIIQQAKLTIGSTRYEILPFIFHDINCPLNKGQKEMEFYRGCF